MAGVISRLTSELANQIAAGEVVERPASAVKELVENALDAGATRVEVAIESGGLGMVSVTDDGAGMIAEDAVLALERHATSKLRTFEDLLQLVSFGFRGEALPSIASVSRFRLITRARGQKEGTLVTLSEGGQAHAAPTGCAEGTRVEAGELFYNVPARRKFLKSVATESGHVNDCVRSAALARPEVTFVVRRDGKVAREYLRATSREERARALAQGEPLLAARFERGPLRVEAFLAPPERARAGANHLDVLVNGRPVRDLRLARAVAQAYGAMLDAGRYPYGVVYLDLPSHEVDINVHPQKSEVRFADSRAIYEALRFSLERELADAFRGGRARPAIASFSAHAPTLTDTRVSVDAVPMTTRSHVAQAADAVVARAAPSASPPEDEASLFRSVRFYATLRYLAQLRATYLLCEGRDGLYVLDQHAAAERLTFHRLREQFAQRGLAGQRLLVAETITLAPEEIAALEAAEDRLAALGMEVRAVGPNTVACSAVPKLLTRHDPKALVMDLASELAQSGPRAFSDRIDLILATMACHGSVRAGDAMSREEAEALLAALDDVDFSLHCPHGRPVLFRLGIEDIERRVHR